MIGTGKNATRIEEYTFDRAVVREIFKCLKQAAMEVGEWGEGHPITDDRGPDLSHLTDEQLEEEVRILRETQEKLDALHAGKPIPRMIEAALNSAITGSVEESGAEVEVAVDRSASSPT